MDKSTLKIKKKIDSLKTHSEKNKFIHNKYSGKTCYIISCGPSLKDFDFSDLKERLKDELVICIKQSYDILKDVCDFHIYNCGNYKNYDYNNSKAMTVECTSYEQLLNEKCDFKYVIKERAFSRTLSISKNFDFWDLSNYSNQNIRPYGPGIMYEIVFYFAQHLGVKEIVTLGWDNTLNKKDDQKGYHFYDYDGYDNIKEHITHNSVDENPVAVSSLALEASITSDCIIDWYFWLNSKGVELKIISDINPATKKIPRIDMEEFLGHE